MIRRTRIRLLYAALRLANLAARRSSRSAAAPELRPFAPGVSVIVPERANAKILADTLEHGVRACREIDEPWEIIVVVNGSPESHYRSIVQGHPAVKWSFSARRLWYSGAVVRGIRTSRYDWVYLLNSDMLLERDALKAVLRWRSPRVFAVASQVYFRNPRHRREETGWTQFRSSGGPIEILDEIAPDDDTVRGTLYAGGGASLFRRYLLGELARGSSAYLPFYWEDVEWGARAWRRGYESLYCPGSRACHLHRMTNRLFYTEDEIDRIMARNRLLFHFRNGPPVRSFAELDELLGDLDPESLEEVLRLGRIANIVVGRLQSDRLPQDHVPLERTWTLQYGTADSTAARV